jgi:hypothetical protein
LQDIEVPRLELPLQRLQKDFSFLNVRCLLESVADLAQDTAEDGPYLLFHLLVAANAIQIVSQFCGLKLAQTCSTHYVVWGHVLVKEE